MLKTIKTFFFKHDRSNIRRFDEVLARVPVGASTSDEGENPQHPLPNAAQGRQRGRIHVIPRQRRQRVSFVQGGFP